MFLKKMKFYGIWVICKTWTSLEGNSPTHGTYGLSIMRELPCSSSWTKLGLTNFGDLEPFPKISRYIIAKAIYSNDSIAVI